MPSLADRLAEVDGWAVDLDLTEGLEPGAVLANAELEGCRLDGSVLEKAVLRGCRFTEVTFTGCNLSMVDLAGSRFTDCRFVECKALAVAWSRADAAPLSQRPWDMERCRLDLGSFRDTELPGARFLDCSMREVDLGGADLQRAELLRCDLTGATLVGTDLREASLVGSLGYAFDPADNRVRGLRVDAPGAGGILRAIGLVVDP
ncbi:pentapeptide repeat-containing protein [Oryzobacter terrae]|uniref:pentapeptide repeat-containing protein n=1 Tax=Oryzobacter terrae TaxID=1620385 RepID=UPI00366F9A9E